MPLRKRGQVTFSAEMFPYYSTSLSISSLFALIVGLFIILGTMKSGQGRHNWKEVVPSLYGTVHRF